MIILLFSYCVKIRSSDEPTVRSDGVYPGLSELVDSQRRTSTPARPISPMRVISIILPSIGETSSLKSPVWNTVPIGVFTAIAQASAME